MKIEPTNSLFSPISIPKPKYRFHENDNTRLYGKRLTVYILLSSINYLITPFTIFWFKDNYLSLNKSKKAA